MKILQSIKIGSFLAVATSMSALALSAWNNHIINSDRNVREAPFVIPSISVSEADFEIELSNFSEVTARIHSVRISDGSREVVLDSGNKSSIVGVNNSDLKDFIGYFFFERFGVDLSNEIGVSFSFNMPSYMRAREDTPFIALSGLDKVAAMLEPDVASTYSARLLSELQFQVCSCNIYEDTCLIAGTEAEPTLVGVCPRQTASTGTLQPR